MCCCTFVCSCPLKQTSVIQATKDHCIIHLCVAGDIYNHVQVFETCLKVIKLFMLPLFTFNFEFIVFFIPKASDCLTKHFMLCLYCQYNYIDQNIAMQCNYHCFQNVQFISQNVSMEQSFVLSFALSPIIHFSFYLLSALPSWMYTFTSLFLKTDFTKKLCFTVSLCHMISAI